MNDDRLKRFIEERREEFDVFRPSGKVWKKIEGEYNAGATRIFRLLPLARTAAAVLVLLALSLLALRPLIERTDAADPGLSGLGSGLSEQQAHYISLIEIKRSELQQLKEREPALYAEFAAEIEKLERSYSALKSDLAEAPDRELVLEAMIQNLRYQIDLLNRQLEIIKKIEEAKKKGSVEIEKRDI